MTQVKSLDFANLADVTAAESYQVTQAELDDAGWSLSPNAAQIIFDGSAQQSMPLNEYVQGKVFRGIISGLNEAFVINDGTRSRLIAQDARSVDLIRPFLLGRNIKRYAPAPSQAIHYLHA